MGIVVYGIVTLLTIWYLLWMLSYHAVLYGFLMRFDIVHHMELSVDWLFRCQSWCI